MSAVGQRQFMYRLWEFFYYRFLRFFVGLSWKPLLYTKFIGMYLAGRKQLSNYFAGQKFYFDPRTGIGQRLFLEGTFEEEELGIIKRYIQPDSVCLDIGANIGLHTVFMASLAVEGYIYSFEPSPGTYQWLRKNAGGCSNVMTHQMGVGSVNRTLDFYETEDNAYGGFKDTKRSGVKGTTSVQVVRIDDLADKLEWTRLDFVKIDVEGFEDEVFSGMSKTMERFKPVIFCEIYGGEASNSDPLATVNRMQERGYKAMVVKGSALEPFSGQHADEYSNYIFEPVA